MQQFIQPIRAFTDDLKDIVANWRSNRPGKNNGFKFEWSMVLPLSVFMEQLLQGINAWMPGSPNATKTALPLVGQTRGLIRGEAEATDKYEARLRNWIGPYPFTADIWSNMGKSAQLAQAIQTYLGNNPVVRVIERIFGGTTARWVTANTDGTISDVVATWDWDSLGGWTDATRTYTGATTVGFWSDFWIVVYPCEWPITGATLASLVPLWGGLSLDGTGHAVTPQANDAIRALLAQYKGDHCWCRAIIWSYDVAKFTPSTPTVDGHYGNWGKPDGSGSTTVARDASARYWIPAQG
jgi:hypothetical protein